MTELCSDSVFAGAACVDKKTSGLLDYTKALDIVGCALFSDG
jgi:hypothetical protein